MGRIFVFFMVFLICIYTQNTNADNKTIAVNTTVTPSTPSIATPASVTDSKPANSAQNTSVVQPPKPAQSKIEQQIKTQKVNAPVAAKPVTTTQSTVVNTSTTTVPPKSPEQLKQQQELKQAAELLEKDIAKIAEQEKQTITSNSPQQLKQQEQIETQEKDIQAEQHHEIINKMDTWIVKEREEFQNNKFSLANTTEIFTFVIKPFEIQSFSVDMTLPRDNKTLNMVVYLYVMNNNTFLLPNNPGEEQFVNLTITESRVTNSTLKKTRILGKKAIYEKTKYAFTPLRPSLYFINFFNNIESQVMIGVAMEASKNVASSASVQAQIDPLQKELAVMLEAMKENTEKRKFSYKWQWGFKENEDQHQSTMLALTGIQLFAIIATAVVQMYCLRNLLDNRSLV